MNNYLHINLYLSQHSMDIIHYILNHNIYKYLLYGINIHYYIHILILV